MNSKKLLTLLLTGFLANPVFAAAKSADANTVTSTGKGEVEIPQTQGTLILAISKDGKDPKAIQLDVKTKADKLIQELKKAKLLSLETTSITVNPRWSYADKTEKIIGYNANYSLQVKAKIDEIGGLIDLATKNGATSISGPGFGVSDKEHEAARLAAIKLATSDAQKQSLATLSALGLKAKSTHRVTVLPDNNNFAYMSYPMGKRSAVSAEAATPIEAGKEKISAQVELTTSY